MWFRPQAQRVGSWLHWASVAKGDAAALGGHRGYRAPPRYAARLSEGGLFVGECRAVRMPAAQVIAATGFCHEAT